MLFTLFFCILALLLAGDSIRLFADFIVINDLNQAGAFSNCLLLLAVVCLLLRSRTSVLGSLSWLLLPFCFVLLLLSILLTAGKMEFRELLPLWDSAGQNAAEAWLRSMASVFVPAFFLFPTLGFGLDRKRRNAAICAGIVSCLLLAALRLRDITVLGFSGAALFRYPAYAAANSLRHSEVLISAVFVLCQPFRAAICLRFILRLLTHRFPQTDSSAPLILTLLAAGSAFLTRKSGSAGLQTLSEAAALLVCLAVPGLFLILKRLYRRNN